MARENRWNPTLADLVVLVIGCGVSTAVLRFVMTDNLTLLGVGVAKNLHYSGAAALSLCPLSWTVAGLAMCRTKRRRWASHPAVVVGVSLLAMSVVNLALKLVVNPRYLTTAGDVRLFVMDYVGYSAEYTASATVAIFVLAAVGRRTRRPKDWLEWSGTIIAVAWIATGACRYVGARM